MLIKPLLFLVLIQFYSFGQDAELRHYQRRHKFEVLPTPAQVFNPSMFNILFADSLYDLAKINVKRAEFLNYKPKVGLMLEARNGLYIQVKLVFKRQKTLVQVVQMIRDVFPSDEIPSTVGIYCLTSDENQIQLEIKREFSNYVVELKRTICN